MLTWGNELDLKMLTMHCHEIDLSWLEILPPMLFRVCYLSHKYGYCHFDIMFVFPSPLLPKDSGDLREYGHTFLQQFLRDLPYSAQKIVPPLPFPQLLKLQVSMHDVPYLHQECSRSKPGLACEDWPITTSEINNLKMTSEWGQRLSFYSAFWCPSQSSGHASKPDSSQLLWTCHIN